MKLKPIQFKRVFWGGVIIGSLLLVLPLLLFGFPLYTHDGSIHVNWLHHVAQQFWEGTFYPRWFPELNDGFGSPAFFYYPPGSSVCGVLFALITPHVNGAVYALGWGAAIGLILSGLTMWLFLSHCVAKGYPAVIGAFLYMQAPYHLGIDLLSRGANAEFWGFVYMPLVLFSFHQVSLKSGTVGVASGEFSLFAFLPWKRRGYTPLKYFIPNASEICGAFCLAGLFCTHVLSAIVFAPIALLYSLFLGRRSFRRCILVGVWAVLLSAAYLLPSVLYASYTSGYGNSVFLGEEISNTFLFHGSPQSEPLTVRIIFISMMVICGVSIAFVKYTDLKHTRTQLVFWIIMLSLCLVMMVRISEPLYACLPVLRRIQFVSRFLSPATLATCVLLTFLMNQWRQHRLGLRLLTGMAMFVFVIPMLAINIRGYTLAFGPERVTNGKMAGIDATGEYLPGSGNLFKARELFPVTRSNGSSDIRILSGSGRASFEVDPIVRTTERDS